MSKKAASVFVQTLKNHNVDRFFCVPGESYLSVMDELLYSPGIEVVTCRHEGGAGFMAVADAKCTGKAGVAFVSRGPGATNASIAVHSAHQGGIPMVLFIGQVNRKSLGKMHLQEMEKGVDIRIATLSAKAHAHSTSALAIHEIHIIAPAVTP